MLAAFRYVFLLLILPGIGKLDLLGSELGLLLIRIILIFHIGSLSLPNLMLSVVLLILILFYDKVVLASSTQTTTDKGQ